MKEKKRKNKEFVIKIIIDEEGKPEKPKNKRDKKKELNKAIGRGVKKERIGERCFVWLRYYGGYLCVIYKSRER